MYLLLFSVCVYIYFDYRIKHNDYYNIYEDYKEFCYKENRACEEFLKVNASNVLGIEGFYSYEGYYCVRTDYSQTKIEEVDDHERLHAMIAESEDLKEHFCGE